MTTPPPRRKTSIPPRRRRRTEDAAEPVGTSDAATPDAGPTSDTASGETATATLLARVAYGLACVILLFGAATLAGFGPLANRVAKPLWEDVGPGRFVGWSAAGDAVHLDECSARTDDFASVVRLDATSGQPIGIHRYGVESREAQRRRRLPASLQDKLPQREQDAPPPLRKDARLHELFESEGAIYLSADGNGSGFDGVADSWDTLVASRIRTGDDADGTVPSQPSSLVAKEARGEVNPIGLFDRRGERRLLGGNEPLATAPHSSTPVSSHAVPRLYSPVVFSDAKIVTGGWKDGIPQCLIDFDAGTTSPLAEFEAPLDCPDGVTPTLPPPWSRDWVVTFASVSERDRSLSGDGGLFVAPGLWVVAAHRDGREWTTLGSRPFVRLDAARLRARAMHVAPVCGKLFLLTCTIEDPGENQLGQERPRKRVLFVAEVTENGPDGGEPSLSRVARYELLPEYEVPPRERSRDSAARDRLEVSPDGRFLLVQTRTYDGEVKAVFRTDDL